LPHRDEAEQDGGQAGDSEGRTSDAVRPGGVSWRGVVLPHDCPTPDRTRSQPVDIFDSQPVVHGGGAERARQDVGAPLVECRADLAAQDGDSAIDFHAYPRSPAIAEMEDRVVLDTISDEFLELVIIERGLLAKSDKSVEHPVPSLAYVLALPSL
jgi:hypothetical protein